MSLRPVYQKILKLNATASSNDKVALLREYLTTDPLFKKVAVYALDSRRTYNIKKFPPFTTINSSVTPNDTLFAFLDELNSTPGTPNAQKEALYLMASSDEETYEVVKRICNGDLKCGCGVKLFNKAVPDSIFDIPYCRCSTDSKINNIMYPAFAQEKADGMFTNIILDYNGKVEFLSREGKPVQQLYKLTRILENKIPEKYYGTVFHGELLSLQNDKIISRKTGNGIFSSCLYGLADQDLADTAIIRLWDAVPIDDFKKESCKLPYKKRFNTILDISDILGSARFRPVEYEVVQALEEAQAFYAKMRKLGKEGAILKNYSMTWKYHTSPNQIKMKNVMDVELNMVDWYLGTSDSKYAKCMGGITCESACKQLVVNVGSGFSDAQRGFKPVPADHPNAILSNDNDTGYTNEDTGELSPPLYIDSEFLKTALLSLGVLMGQVAGLECESIIKSKTKDTYSLYLPRFVEVRIDKKADTLEELLSR